MEEDRHRQRPPAKLYRPCLVRELWRRPWLLDLEQNPRIHGRFVDTDYATVDFGCVPTLVRLPWPRYVVKSCFGICTFQLRSRISVVCSGEFATVYALSTRSRFPPKTNLEPCEPQPGEQAPKGWIKAQQRRLEMGHARIHNHCASIIRINKVNDVVEQDFRFRAVWNLVHPAKERNFRDERAEHLIVKKTYGALDLF